MVDPESVVDYARHFSSMCPILQNAFANATQGFSLFSSMGYGQPDVMFSDSTLKLMRVMGTYQSWLGHSYTTMLQAFECEGKLCLFSNLLCKAHYGSGFKL